MDVSRSVLTIGRSILLLGAIAAAVDLAAAQTLGTPESDRSVGRWKPWVLTSSSQFRVPPPPDETASRTELQQLRAMIASRDPGLRDRILWWDAVAPAYRWNQIAREEAIRAGLNANLASRRLALLHIALADVTVAAWDSKFAYNRPRPTALDHTLPTVVPTPELPSYPDDHAAAGAAAAVVLGEFFPQRAAEFAKLGRGDGTDAPSCRRCLPKRRARWL